MRKPFFILLFIFAFGFLAPFNHLLAAPVLLEDSIEFNNRKGGMIRSISTIDEVPIGTVIPWPVGDISSEGFEVPPAWRICNGQVVQFGWYSRLPKDLQMKWYTHAISIIGNTLPNYNTSSAPGNKGVFLRGNTEISAQYMTTQKDMFRSHLHGQPKHTHPFDLDVDNNQVAGQFEGQVYWDTVSRMRYGDHSLMEATSSAAWDHLNRGYGLSDGLYAAGAASGELASGYTTTIPSMEPSTSAGAKVYCNKGFTHGASVSITNVKETDAYSITIDNRRTGISRWGMDSMGSRVGGGLWQRTADDGTYTGKVNDRTVTGRIHEAGNERYYTNDNYHNDGKTKNEDETTPTYMNVLYIIKVLP